MIMRKLVFFLIAVVALSSCENMSITYSDGGMDMMSSNSGIGGSMARFAVVGDYMYAVSDYKLKVFDLSNVEHSMSLLGEYPLSWEVETIFPVGDFLYLGTLSGMYIIDISTPTQPEFVSEYSHVVSCDPVVVYGDYAYVTLHSDDNSFRCWRNVNEIQVIDISDKTAPKEILSITDGVEKPLGLGVTKDYLFVCDNGLKVYDRSDPAKPVFLKKFNIRNPYDVIPINDILMVTGEDGIRQYLFNSDTVVEVSFIPVESTLNSKN